METLEKTKSEIVKIKASDYGLEESKAKEIESMFTPMLTKMVELEDQYNYILTLPVEPETCQMAKDLRLAYVKTRTGTEKIHKDLKAFYLSGGRFVDAFKNTQAFASGEKEKNLKAIEDHFENMERERLEKLRLDRLEMIKPYTDIEPLALGHMEQTVFDNLLAGFKVAYEVRIAAEKKAEEDRIAKEKADAEQRELQQLENIRLQKEAKKREAQITAEREQVRKENEERDRLAEIERKKQAEILRKQKEESDRKEVELRKKVDNERKERERLAKELQDKKEADEKAKRDLLKKLEAEKKAKIAEEKKAAKAPDKVKLTKWVESMLISPLPAEKLSKESIDIANDIFIKFDAFKVWAKTQIDLL